MIFTVHSVFSFKIRKVLCAYRQFRTIRSITIKCKVENY